MDVHPIKTELDYNAALAEIERLMDAAPDTTEGDRLDLLVTLVEAYEAKHHAINLPDPIEAIKFQMEQMGLSRKELEPFIGSRARVTEVLNRKRNLSLEMIRRLHEGLKIPADVLIRPSLPDLGVVVGTED
ncbi:MAG: helix-turn-helix domain-containing protein [Magnetococcales bacterium]|nr:helix-turn-helix domain-containing protein [Magnetococcales bacterium]